MPIQLTWLNRLGLYCIAIFLMSSHLGVTSVKNHLRTPLHRKLNPPMGSTAFALLPLTGR